ncbi:hypothetical protein [uncultured Mailhella sp.]|uniref:hypothetical protein n=1 Tax=uncultured Mailhella sp. TaxID=1981031 RepID=UPI0025CC9A65|nr:hypothetical protein [uncultured Mailhella sp.]
MAAFNLEPVCARYGMDLVTLYKDEKTGLDDRENIVTKALDVLVENGVYAMTVFLLTCNKDKFGLHVLKSLASLLADDKVNLISKKDVPPGMGREGMLELLTAMRRLTEDMETLFMARRVLEGALTFARYHCKALSRLKKEEGK